MEQSDLLFYVPSTIFGKAIGLFNGLKEGKIKIKWFSHVAMMRRNSEGRLQRYDAMEGLNTGFREPIGQCYVYRIKNLSEEDKSRICQHLHSRMGSEYDSRGILSFIFTRIKENEFEDYCSELIMNALKMCDRFWYLLKYGKITPYKLFKILKKNGDIEFIWLNLN